MTRKASGLYRKGRREPDATFRFREESRVTITIHRIGPCFVGEVEGIDLCQPLSSEDVGAIHAGMDQYAVLVFHGQPISDEQQLAFTRSLGEIEHAIGTSLRAPEDYRLPTTFADVSNLDRTTVRPCTARGLSRPTNLATCAVPRWPATDQPQRKSPGLRRPEASRQFPSTIPAAPQLIPDVI